MLTIDKMPECLCRRHPRCRCPAILNADYDVAHTTQFKFDLLRVSLFIMNVQLANLFGLLYIIVSQAIKEFVGYPLHKDMSANR